MLKLIVIHLANNVACKSYRISLFLVFNDHVNLNGSTSPMDLAVHSCFPSEKVANLMSMNTTQCPEM